MCSNLVDVLASSTPETEGTSSVLIVFVRRDLSQPRLPFHWIVSIQTSVHAELEARSEVVVVDLSMDTHPPLMLSSRTTDGRFE